jgi:predicted DNA-binding WGR domain protein
MSQPRRFEYTDAKSNEFWEVTVAEATVTVRCGHLATDGQTQVKSYGSAAEAAAAAEKLIAEKVKKGYCEIGAVAANEVDTQQLAAIWKLLGQDDLASVQQGISLLRSLDDQAIWASLAEGLSIDKAGRLVIPDGCEVHKRQPRAYALRMLVALWALRQDGRLTGLQELNLSRCTALTDPTPLAGLTSLRTLTLSECTALTDLTPLAGLTDLHTLDVSG